MSWNAVTFFQNLDESGNETYKVDPNNGLLSMEEIIKFEDEMLLRENLQFTNTIKNFLENLITDVQNIIKGGKLSVSAYKFINREVDIYAPHTQIMSKGQ